MQYTNKYNLPKSLYEAIILKTYDVPDDFNIISVTQMINPPKIRQLALRHPGELRQDISESIWLLLGSCVHEVLSRINVENRIIEERMKIKISDMELWGKPDLYDKAEQRITDYKVTSVWSVIYNSNEPAHIAQLNVYAWMLKQNGYPIKDIEVVLILKDWNAKEAKKGRKYPPIPVVVKQLPLWRTNEQQSYIMNRIAEHKKVQHMFDDHIPVCSEEERWYSEREKIDKRCEKYCIVSHLCNHGKKYCK